MPYLLICAFIANAASFVLPISNPANLVIYGSHTPPLPAWLPRYALPSLLCILATYAVLRWTQRDALRQEIAADIEVPALSAAGRMAAFGILMTAIVLLVSSGFDVQLWIADLPGWPRHRDAAAWASGVVLAVGCNLVNNLPAIAGAFVAS